MLDTIENAELLEQVKFALEEEAENYFISALHASDQESCEADEKRANELIDLARNLERQGV